MSTRLGCRLAVALALAIAPPAAGAQPSDKAGAEALFEQARRLMDAKRFAEACEKFAASHRLDPAVGTLLNLAECNERLDHLATAWAYYREAQALAQARSDSDRERYAREHAGGLEPRLAKLTIAARQIPPGLEVKKDGLPVTIAALGTALPVDVGGHALEAVAPGRKRWTGRVEVPRDGVSVSVDVPALEEEDTPQREGSAVLPPGQSTPQREAPSRKVNEDEGLGVQRTAALVSAGVGVVAIGFGAVMAERAWSNWQDARPHCSTQNVCDDFGFQQGQTAHRQGDLATAGLVIGLAGLALGAVLWLTAPAPRRAPGLRPATGFAGVWFVGELR
jgi:hypothetical protein